MMTNTPQLAMLPQSDVSDPMCSCAIPDTAHTVQGTRGQEVHNIHRRHHREHSRRLHVSTQLAVDHISLAILTNSAFSSPLCHSNSRLVLAVTLYSLTDIYLLLTIRQQPLLTAGPGQADLYWTSLEASQPVSNAGLDLASHSVQLVSE